MPELQLPPVPDYAPLDAPESPLWLPGDPMGDPAALTLVKDTFQRLSAWRSYNQDPRWRLNEWLYYGYVPPRNWEGSNVPRSSLPIQVSFDQVEAAHAKLTNELFASDELLSVIPTGSTDPREAAQIRDRLYYLLDHNIDDYGWSARTELSETLKDQLIYGTCFGLIEYDYDRKQATVRRVDPRDVYVDPGTTTPYIERARVTIVRLAMTLEEVDALRHSTDLKIPNKNVLYYLSRNRHHYPADNTKMMQEAARGTRYTPIADDLLPLPSDNFIDVFIYQGRGREIWSLNNEVIIYNETYPYGCSRLVSAPCFTVPNRFYAQSLVDILDPIQQVMTSLVNWHLDEIALAMRPPRAAKSGVTRTPSSLSWRPGLVNEFADPQKDQVVYQPQGITSNVWQTLGFFDDQAGRRSGQNSLAVSGQPTPSNANRTRGGMQMQMQGPTERLARIAANYEDYLLTPLCYKLLKVEKAHAEEGGVIYGKRSQRRNPASLTAAAGR